MSLPLSKDLVFAIRAGGAAGRASAALAAFRARHYTHRRRGLTIDVATLPRMSAPWHTLGFVAQSITIGLALAFVAVLVKPDLVNWRSGLGGRHVSYAVAVTASAPAVVNIYTERSLSPYGRDSGIVVRGRALGSGVVIDPQGYIVTNWHVIQGAEQIGVQLADGRIAVPALVGTDP